MSTVTTAEQAVETAARAAHRAAPQLAGSSAEMIDRALRAMATRLAETAEPLLAANADDVAAAQARGDGPGVIDRLRLDSGRLAAMADQLNQLAAIDAPAHREVVRTLDGGLVVELRHRPVGVIGANFEARPNVVVDIASQLIKSRNAGVLRTGTAALASAVALHDHVIAPALAAAGLPAEAVQLIRVPGREAATALVSQGALIPLVILRGSGDSTRSLAELAARNGVRTLAHADGGAVLYLDRAADPAKATALVDAGLDRLGVCNRLNLLLVHRELWDDLVPRLVERLAARTPAIRASLPPHGHALGYEWALDSAAEATVTIAPADGPLHAADLANEQTSGLAAGIVTEDGAAAAAFLTAYCGTGAFWNATTRLLDGFKLLGIPETGINIDKVPGPRGPVTFRDLVLRQYVVAEEGRL
ncbi:aldehyde dehydrogenase family protein [Catellatospora methionotrophica]|uniref:aldehyde dehydrogenase family protein n=1 Tax=Catellatospora methionotrophica TaxID=121620 RepID=UPI0033E143F1